MQVTVTVGRARADRHGVRNESQSPRVGCRRRARRRAQDWDRGGKFANYRTIGSVVDYLLVAQNRCHVELFHRASEGERWIFTETDGIDSTVDLASIEVRLELRQLYHKLEDLGWSR